MTAQNAQQPIIAAEKEQTLYFTESAALKTAELLSEEGNSALKLRVFISGGGCSGFQYGFTFDETMQLGDLVIEKEVIQNNAPLIVQLLVDPMSLQYLQGATIDYKEDLDGARFIIQNPNAKTTCGCGSSFAINDDAAQ